MADDPRTGFLAGRTVANGTKRFARSRTPEINAKDKGQLERWRGNPNRIFRRGYRALGVLLGNTWRVSVLGVVLSLVALPSVVGDQEPKQSIQHVPVVEDLVQLLQGRPDLRAALEGAIRTADLKGLRDMDSFLIYLDGFVTFVPTEHEVPTALKLYYIVNQAPGDQLNRDKSFSAWIRPRPRRASLHLWHDRTTTSAITSWDRAAGSPSTSSLRVR